MNVRTAIVRVLLSVFTIALFSPVARAQYDESLPDIVDTDDVLDWIAKWTGTKLYPSQFGPPGWPGKDPELMGLYGYRGNNWGWPEMIPYPGAAEHIRVNMQRYIPVYPIYHANTLVKDFRATTLPGMHEDQITEYAEPVYRVPKYCYPNPEEGRFTDVIKLGKYREPVKVVRFDQHHKPVSLEIGKLKPSSYAVRLIAATDSERVQQSSRRLVIHLEVNDGPNGETNTYKKRCAASDQFYSVVEFFFMAPTTREYRITVRVDASSELPLYLYNIDVHDRFAQLANRAGKRSASFYDEKERAAKWAAAGGPKLDTRSKKERMDADADQWTRLPTLNSQPRGDERFWTSVVTSVLRLPPDKVDDGMGIDVHGSDMIWNVPEEEYATHKRAGSYEAAALAGRYWRLQRQTYYGKAAEIGRDLGRLRRWHSRYGGRDVTLYEETGDEAAARRVALRLAMISVMNMFNMDGFRQQMVAIDCIPELGWNQGDLAFRRRKPAFYGQLEKVKEFDTVFPYIRDNAELAESLGRFIPWIKTVEDMHRFYEVGLIQLPAHETMLYQRRNAYLSGSWMSWYIACQQDPEITKPWLHWLFRYVWTYPRMPAGVDETMFMSWTRDGTTTIGSTYYSHTSLTALRDILKNLTPPGQDPMKSLPIQVRVPELLCRAYWESRFTQDCMVAGGYRFWIGDVSGPTRTRFKATGTAADTHVDAKNRSRVLSNWFGVLETNVDEDDFRQRRAAGLRVGWGMGHAHDDPLDLQIWALGVPLAGDWGCRGGYCFPDSKILESHNTVVAGALLKDKKHRWVSSIADAEGARYLMGRARCDGFYGRQLALIDVDDPTPNSYVVDIFRVRGGKKPYYAFHGPPPDEFHTNVENVKKGYPKELEKPLFDPEHNWYGTISSRLIATWRMSREPMKLEWQPSEKKKKSLTWFGMPGSKPEKQIMTVPGAEKMAMGADFDPSEPRKHIRMHLLGHNGAVAFGRRGYGVRAEKFINDMLYVFPADWQGQTVFPVVFEPFGDERIIRDVRLLCDEKSVQDSSAPIAIEIRLRNQRRDMVYTALRDSESFTVPEYGEVRGEYAFLSYDADGLRQATLVGGTRLQAEGVEISLPRPAYEGEIVAGLASERTLTLSGVLPKSAEDDVMEVGPPDRRTSYTIKSVDAKKVVTHKDFALAMTRIKGFLMEDGMPFTNCKIYSASGVPISNEKGDQWWRLGRPYELIDKEKPWPDGGTAHPAEIPPRGKAVRLVGKAAPREHMVEGQRIWVHEMGVGDRYRLPIHVNVIRRDDGTYDVRSNGEAKVTIAGKPANVREPEQ